MGQWGETKHKDMLHLEDNARIRMGKTCVEYFKEIYTECRTRLKNKGLKHSREELLWDVLLNSYDLRKIHEPNLWTFKNSDLDHIYVNNIWGITTNFKVKLNSNNQWIIDTFPCKHKFYKQSVHILFSIFTFLHNGNSQEFLDEKSLFGHFFVRRKFPFSGFPCIFPIIY